jgi:hypothetical protein
LGIVVIFSDVRSPVRLRDMKIQKFNKVTELKKLASGKPTKVSAQTLAHYALEYVPKTKPKKAREDVEFLERLFSLVDPR